MEYFDKHQFVGVGSLGRPNNSHKWNTHDNLIGTKTELYKHINLNLVKDRKLDLPVQDGIMQQLTKLEQSEKKEGTILLVFRKDGTNPSVAETVYVEFR